MRKIEKDMVGVLWAWVHVCVCLCVIYFCHCAVLCLKYMNKQLGSGAIEFRRKTFLTRYVGHWYSSLSSGFASAGFLIMLNGMVSNVINNDDDDDDDENVNRRLLGTGSPDL